MKPAQPGEPRPSVSSSSTQQRTTEVDGLRRTRRSALPSTLSSSTPGCPLESPAEIRAAKRRRGRGGQAVASQERTTRATSAAEPAGVRRQIRPRRRRTVAEAQLAEGRRVGSTAASQDSNAEAKASKGEGDEGDLTDVEAGFEETTAMAMKDRVARSRHRNALTADVRTVFEKAERVCEDGTVRSGHWCEICRRYGRGRDAWFASSTTGLRTHIRRFADTHYETYVKRCAELGISPHPRTQPRTQQKRSPNQGESSTTRDAMQWSREGLLDRIVGFIVTYDEPLNVVDWPHFRALLRFQRPATQEADIPHRTAVTQKMLDTASRVKQLIKERYQNVPGKISITFDAYTSRAFDPYLAITAHYIDAPPDSASSWRLVSDVIAFEHVPGAHSGANLASVIACVVDRFGFRSKFGWATADNASVNDKAIRCLAEAFSGRSGSKLDAKQIRIRCMAHSLNLAAKRVLEAFAPTPRRVFATGQDSRAARPADVDQDEIDEDGEPNENELIHFEPGDLLGKVHAFVTQVRLSPQARTFFSERCAATKVAQLELLKWCRTRWSSADSMIERLLRLQPAVQDFIIHADGSDKVPKLSNGRQYTQFEISSKEWAQLGLIHEVLEEIASAQHVFSKETEATVTKAVAILEWLQTRWEQMAQHQRYQSLAPAIRAGLDSLRKWYKELDVSDAYLICHVLDPTLKLAYVEAHWDAEYYKHAEATIERVYDSYCILPSSSRSAAGTAPAASNAQTGPDALFATCPATCSMTWMRSAVQRRAQAEVASVDHRQELYDYLSSPLVNLQGCTGTLDLVAWWGNHATSYPTLACVARDYLAIQGSAVKCERAFSSSGQTITDRRNSLHPQTVGALQILKSAYANGHISVDEGARTLACTR